MKRGGRAWASGLDDGDAVTILCVYLMTSQHRLTLGGGRRTVQPPPPLPRELGLDWPCSADGDCGGEAGVRDGVQGPFLQQSPGRWDGQRL